MIIYIVNENYIIKFKNMVKKLCCILFVSVIYLQTISGQCTLKNLNDNTLNSGNSPAFEFNIPDGVTIDSIFLDISNFDAGGTCYYRSRGRSFTNLETVIFNNNGTYKIVRTGTSATENYQVESGLFELDSSPDDYAKFDWVFRIYASGTSGINLSYSGELGDNLANPTNIGSIYNGLNTVSGIINIQIEGTGIELYPDMDFDGYGDNLSEPIKLCTEYSTCAIYVMVDNNLDCDDDDDNINPANGNCDQATFINENMLNSTSIYPNPATNFIYINLAQESEFTIAIKDILGNTYLTANSLREINISHLPKGTYLIEVSNDRGDISHKKFVKK
jgi:hypothetical protein